MSRPSPAKAAAKPRDAARTRAAILESAREAFSQRGYDGAGVREIAAGAGVSAMMVNRYFGSKRGLFGEVLADTMRDPVILSDANLSAADRAAAMAAALVSLTAKDAQRLDGFRIMFNSASSPDAAEIARTEIARNHGAALAASLTGPHAAERAAIFMSLVAGLQGMRQMIGLPTLADADADLLTTLLSPLMRQLLDPPATA